MTDADNGHDIDSYLKSRNISEHDVKRAEKITEQYVRNYERCHHETGIHD